MGQGIKTEEKAELIYKDITLRTQILGGAEFIVLLSQLMDAYSGLTSHEKNAAAQWFYQQWFYI